MSKNRNNMTVQDLKGILKDLPDNMPVIIPVILEDDANCINGFRHVRTAGLLEDPYSDNTDPDKQALCLNAAADGLDISSQIKLSGRDVKCKRVLF